MQGNEREVKFDEHRWHLVWARLLAAFEAEAGEAPGNVLEAWEQALLTRLFGQELPPGGKGGAKSRRSATRRQLDLHAEEGESLTALEQRLRRLASKAWTQEAADRIVEDAALLERSGDLAGTEDAYRRALLLGPSRPLDVAVRLAQLQRVLGAEAEGGRGATEAQLRIALGDLSAGPLPAPRKAALGRLVLLLCQEGREEEALPLLQLGGWRYRLAPWVLRYPIPEAPLTVEASQASPLKVLEGAWPPALLRHLQELLRPGAAFWREHGYDEVLGSGENGYFSYLHSLTGPAASTMDLAARHVLSVAKAYFPELAEATAAEWWAHCRPHVCGHQMHFDSDNEGVGGARHPICSCVAFVDAPDGFGGPTLVTDQKLSDSSLAARGWLVYPKTGRLAVYDGSVLHGVLPGHGEPPATTAKGSRRITWMVAFWKQIQLRPFGSDGLAGSSRPLPDTSGPAQIGSKRYTWQQELALSSISLDSDLKGATDPLVLPLASWPAVWVPVEPSAKDSGPVSLPAYGECFQF